MLLTVLISALENIGGCRVAVQLLCIGFNSLYMDESVSKSYVLLLIAAFPPKSTDPPATGERRLSLLRKLVGRIVGLR